MNTPEIFDIPMSASQFNRMKWYLYGDNVVSGIVNNVPHEPKGRSFPELQVNYGYVVKSRCSWIMWKKWTSDLGC